MSLAAWQMPPYKARTFLAKLGPIGYISYSAVIHHSKLELGKGVFIGDRVVIFRSKDGGVVRLGDEVEIYGDTTIETGEGGSLEIGNQTHIQPGCRFSAYRGDIRIGQCVEIAPNCAFYPYNHESRLGQSVRIQPLVSRGGIRIGDEAWLGVGVIVLDGVRIGEGAVVGAGAVVTKNIPDWGIAAGVPARLVKMREPA